MIDIIVIAVIVLIVGAAVAYIIKAKKSGKRCIGCPDGCSCSSKGKQSTAKTEDCGCGCCGCHGETESK